MRTLLLGSDIIYNTNGNLVPIEINTNLGMDGTNLLEEEDDIFFLNDLETFIVQNNFTKVSYIGFLEYLSGQLQILCNKLNIPYTYYRVATGYAIPDVPDYPEHLIIRSAYDYSAIVDETYCKNKINFLNLIKNQPFATEFAYKDENDILVSNITTIPDYGNQPNFILKSVLPSYDIEIYPKLYKVTNQSELNIILENVNQNYFLMTFWLNSEKFYLNHIRVMRSFNLLFPPDLQNITIGQYTRLPNKSVDELSVFDPITFELNNDDRIKYITKDALLGPKLLDTDRVELSDGTFKTALQLEVGDIIKTLDIPNPNHVDINQLVYSYEMDYATLVSGTTYSQNVINNKVAIDKIVDYVKITFTDDTIWEDTKNSSYLTLRDDIVYFRFLDFDDVAHGIKAGDQIILVDTAYEELRFILKEIKTFEITHQIFSGWAISVDEEKLFLTQSNDTVSYAAVEHNINCYSAVLCQVGGCGKDNICCYNGSYFCLKSSDCTYCNPG